MASDDGGHNLRRLDGKVALVTGATQGVGEGIALKFAKEGAIVVINGRSADKGERTLHTLKSLGARDPLFLRADVGQKDQAKKLVEDTVLHFGRIDVLVNNAMLVDVTYRSEEDSVDASIARVIPSGLLAPLWLAQAAFPHMRKAGGGRIINFGSTSSVFGNRYSIAYNTVKEAIRSLTRTLAQEWGEFNITVNTLMPAAYSPGHERLVASHLELAAEDPGLRAQQERLELVSPYQPFWVMQRAEEAVAPTAVGLASESGRFITGQTIFADGGLHVWGMDQDIMMPGSAYQVSSERA